MFQGQIRPVLREGSNRNRNFHDGVNFMRRMAVVLLKGCRELRPRQNYGRWVDVPHESAWLDDLSRAKDGALVHPRRGNTEAGCAVSTGFRASCEERRIIAAPAGTTFVARLVRVSIQGQRL
jgi:hypothetical protein